MKRVLWATVGLCVVFCLWWAALAFGQAGVFARWVEHQHSAGRKIQISDQSRFGFPASAALGLGKIDLADPITGLILNASGISLSQRALWPGHLHASVERASLSFPSPEAKLSAQLETSEAQLKIKPALDLELDLIRLAFGTWRFGVAEDDPLFSGDNATFSAAHVAANGIYQVQLDVPGLSPGPAIRDRLALPPSLPPSFTAFFAHVGLTFNAPVNRVSLLSQTLQLVGVSLKDIDLHWGRMRLRMSGDLVQDTQGFAQGSVTLRAEQWHDLFKIARNVGAIPTQLDARLEALLRGLAEGTDDPETLVVTIVFRQGQTRLGPFPIGPAPLMRNRLGY